MPKYEELRGKTVLVTGAGSGIGRGTAKRFAEEGARVAVVDINLDAAQATVDLLGSGAMALQADVTSSASFASALSTLVAENGSIDVAINIAGLAIPSTLADLSDGDWTRLIDVNLKSVYVVSKAVWPHMSQNGGGAIVNTASIGAFWALPNDAAYCAAKAGVVMLTKALAIEGGSKNIRVNCVCPGYTQTPMLEGWFEEIEDAAAERRAVDALHPLGRMGRVDDVAEAFLFLASAPWITGTSLVVDGGATTGFKY